MTRSCLAAVLALVSSHCTPRAPSHNDLSEASAAPVATPAPAPTPPPTAAAVAESDASTDASIPDASALTPPPGMLLVPGGTFTMGANEGGQEDERPAHSVTLAPFFLDRTEVTQAAYEGCVKQQACAEADRGLTDKFSGRFRGPNRPVIGVSWFDAHKFCTVMQKRLPREAEFERAVRGDDGRKFPWGSATPTKALAVFSSSATEDVGLHPLGRGPYGHDDLAGNVWEWIEDDYDPLAYSRTTANVGAPGSCAEIIAAQDRLRREGRQGFTGTNPIPTECEKAIRGGAYNYDAYGLRSTNRVHHPARFRLLMTGFRCAKDI